MNILDVEMLKLVKEKYNEFKMADKSPKDINISYVSYYYIDIFGHFYFCLCQHFIQ